VNKDGKPLTYTQRKALEKEQEEYEKMFELFDSKAEINYLHSEDDDMLAACAYGNGRRVLKPAKSFRKSLTDNLNESISGYDFDSLIKDDSSSCGDNSFNISE
jgi:acid phosphatase class B